MKKKLAILSLVFSAFLLISCSAKDNGVSKSQKYGKELMQDVQNNFNAAKEKDFFNLSFSEKSRLIFPENIAEFSNIEILPTDMPTQKDFLNNFKEQFSYYLPGKEFEYSHYYFAPYDSKLNEKFWLEIGYYPKTSDYEEQIKSDYMKTVCLMYETALMPEYGGNGVTGNDCFFLMFNDTNYIQYNQGKAFKLADVQNSIGGLLPKDMFEYVETLPENSNKKYKLLDKELSPQEAKTIAYEYLNSNPNRTGDLSSVSVVGNADVYKITDDAYGYEFQSSREYNGIPFDYFEGGQYSDYNYYFDTGNIFICESNNIELAYITGDRYNVNKLKTFDSIVMPESALDLFAREFTSGVKFDILKMELVYCPSKIDYNIPESERPIQTAVLSWKIELFNNNDNLIYRAFIDAENGENFRYYTTKK
ncbi:MAG: hypothetical protein LBM93_06180 [Oscillospiraceae bacterium]|jgi:hypothetical protein|nr:hypothetical protein [Oscillospiraceae bacterium]